MILTVVTSLLSLGLTVWAVFWLKRRKIYKLTAKIPGPKTVPIFGNSLQFPSDAEDFYLYMESLCATYRDSGFYRLWFGPHLAILVYRADLLEPFFNSSKHITKSFFYKLHEPWLKTGLLTSTGEKWHKRRKMITPTFHFKILEEFLEIMNEQVRVLFGILDEKCGEEAFDAQPVIAHCTLDIICETAMGCHVNAQKIPGCNVNAHNQESEYVQALYANSQYMIRRVKEPWTWWDFLYKCLPAGKAYFKTVETMHSFTRRVIKERSVEFDRQWEKLKEKGEVPDIESDTKPIDFSTVKPIRIGKRQAFLDMLLWAAKRDPTLTHDDIQEEVDTFMFEGHDTTAATAIWALYVIGRHPEIQAKIHQEVDRVFGDQDRDVTMEDLNQFKYLECVYKESMRLYPTVPIFGREFCEDCEIGGCFVPKGATALIMSYPLHRDPKYFPDPDKLDPDRWLTDNPTEKHPFSYVPFSAGLRNCVGQRFAIMEEKVLLSRIMHRYHVICLEPDDIERSGLVILRPSKGLRIKLTRRNV